MNPEQLEPSIRNDQVGVGEKELAIVLRQLETLKQAKEKAR